MVCFVSSEGLQDPRQLLRSRGSGQERKGQN